MIGQIKLIGGVKTIVPLDKNLVPELDLSTPNNALLKFSNVDNTIRGTGWKEVVQCNGQVHSLTLEGTVTCNRSIDITRSYSPNTWGTYNWECPERDRLAIGASNLLNGHGYKQIYGFANVACPMCDSTTILLGSANYQCVGATTGLALGIGVFNYFYNNQGSTAIYGLSNCNYGICATDLPAECAACAGISENAIVGINNHVCSAWSHVHGSGNIIGGWASINSEDPDTHVITNTKIVGTIDVFGNSNNVHGAGTLVYGHNNSSCYSLNTALIGVDNHAYGCSDAGYKYNQFAFGINNCSRGFDTIAIGTTNTVNAPATTNIGHWNTIAAGAAGGLAIGNGAYVYHCNGFTRSAIRAGGSGIGPGTTCATNYATGVWMVSGCGTLNDFYYAMAAGGQVEHQFVGDLKLSLGATCATFNFMNKYNGVCRTCQASGDIWFTSGAFSFQNNVEWFLSSTNTHDNFLLRDAYQYINCPVEAHIILVTA